MTLKVMIYVPVHPIAVSAMWLGAQKHSLTHPGGIPVIGIYSLAISDGI